MCQPRKKNVRRGPRPRRGGFFKLTDGIENIEKPQAKKIRNSSSQLTHAKTNRNPLAIQGDPKPVLLKKEEQGR